MNSHCGSSVTKERDELKCSATAAWANDMRSQLSECKRQMQELNIRLGLEIGRKNEQLTTVTKERDELVAAIETTLDENGHLADGDNCTLIALKRALAKLGADKTGDAL